jgi:hypothetical protein
MPTAQKIPVTPEQAAAFQSLSITHTPCNAVWLKNGDSYNITGPEREEMIADYFKLDKGTMTDAEFADKWQNLKYPD